jgi:hypothetical protein
MVASERAAFNKKFTNEAYQQLLHYLNSKYNYEIEFRIAETPVFVDRQLKQKMLQACEEILSVIKRPDFKELTDKAIPNGCYVQNEDAHTQFLAIDLAICKDENDGTLTPRLIEMQGFPSLFAFQEFISKAYEQFFEFSPSYKYLFSGLNSEQYLALLKKTICGTCAPEEVILMDIEPMNQKTKIDFYCTEDYIGVKPVCISALRKDGKKLYYELSNGNRQYVKRIYNRVIFDELLQRKDLNLHFDMTEDLDVQWAGHPNWFFRISKYTMPFIKSEYVPQTHFLHELSQIPDDLENYVLKPLFSFAGTGVIYDVKASDIEAIADRHNYILQKKIHYAPALITPDGDGVKAEIRMLFLWPEADKEPTLCTNLVRLSKGVMMGVKFNKNKTWVGGSTAFFEE